MKSELKLRIKKRTQTEILLWILMWFPFCYGFLVEFVGFPWGTRYILDIVWVLLLVMMLHHNRIARTSETAQLFLWVSSFLVICTLVYFVQYQSGLYYLWGFRNIFRFYAAFFAYVAFLKADDIDTYFDVIEKLFWFNFVISLIQYYGLKIKGDYLGGIFGVTQGVNGTTNIFLLIVVIKSLVFFVEKKERAISCVLKCIAALLLSAMTELKFFYVEFIAVITMTILVKKITWRTLWIVLGAVAALSLFTSLMAIFFPQSASRLSFEWFHQEATSNKG